MNFYNTAEKPLENTTNKEKNVLFYSDGFKRIANNINPILNNNLYIYNESQADYQSLSKFYHNHHKNEEFPTEDEGLNNYYLDKNYKNIQKSENKNISESAEFKNDESINDREEKNQEHEDIPEQDEEIHEISQREIVQNQGFFKSFNSQIQKNKGNRIDFGETV